MKIVFRADASATIGHGHVMRCLTLAAALRQRGAEVSFICREHLGHLCDLLEERRFPVSRLPAPDREHPVDGTPAHAAWLGTSWQEDVKQTRDTIEAQGGHPDWLIVDHYALDQRWEDAVREDGGRVMVIDDLADRRHNCDLLLDQNLVALMYSRYNSYLPEACGRLLGPEYALLQPIYANLHTRTPPREGPIRRVLIAFGGADAANMTSLALAAFLGLDRPEIAVDVIVSVGSAHTDSIRRQTADHPNVRLHYDLPTLAPLILQADLAIGAAGATSWERLCLGLPTLLVTLAPNQHAIALELNQRRLARWLGHAEEVGRSTISDALTDIIQRGVDPDWSKRCLASVDGKGTDRVAAALTTTEATVIETRHAAPADEDRLLEWTTGRASQGRASNPEAIAAKAFRSRFRSNLRNITSHHDYVIQTIDGVPIGHVGFSREEQGWTTALAVAPPYKQVQLGRRLFQMALLELRKVEPDPLLLEPAGGPNGSLHRVCGTRTSATGTEARVIAVCSGEKSWINTAIPDLLLDWLALGHRVHWAHDAALLPPGDMCFYLGYGRIVEPEILARHRNNLVVHASDLPKGRGWSPLSWRILEGKNRIPVTLFEAAVELDSGPIYKQVEMEFSGNELLAELQTALSQATQELCRHFVREYPEVASTGMPQQGKPSFYKRRRPQDSQLDVDRSMREQLNLLRIADYERYPAWFRYGDVRFKVKIEKMDP